MFFLTSESRGFSRGRFNIEEKTQGKYEVKSTGKLYSVHVDAETNELMYIVNNGEFVFEAGSIESEKTGE